MSQPSISAWEEFPGGIPGEEHLEWIATVPEAVLALASLTHRNVKKGCRKGHAKRSDGSSVEKLYVLLDHNRAVDLGWLGSKLPLHLLKTLVCEQVPEAASSIPAARSPNHAGGRWTTYITTVVNTMLMMGQLGADFSLAAGRLLESSGNRRQIFVDGLILAKAVGLASCFTKREEGYDSDGMECTAEVQKSEEAAQQADPQAADAKSDAMEVEGATAGAARTEEGAAGEEQPGRVKEEGETERAEEEGNERATQAAKDGAADADGEREKEREPVGDEGNRATRWEPVDLVGVVMQTFALFLRSEYKATTGATPKGKSAKGKGRLEEGGAGEGSNVPFLQLLAKHDKVRPAMVDGLFDALGTFFDAMDHSSQSKHKTLVSYIANAIEVLYFCSWDEEYVAELVVSDCMYQGRAFSMLKKVLLMEQAEIVSNMLRWLLRFSEYEDPPTQDILAGYELDSRLLNSIIERNNNAMVAWGAKQPYNSLACDLLKAVEIFADDSNFKAQVIDSSAEALASVLKRGAEYNGFGKADSMHLSFTYAFFKLLAALHCFNPQVMPAEQENHFVIALAAECRTKEQRDGVRGSLEFLLTLPEVIKRAKDNACDPVMDEDLVLVEELLAAFIKQCERGSKASAPKGGGAKKDSKAKAEKEKEKAEKESGKDREEPKAKGANPRGKSGGQGGGGGGGAAGAGSGGAAAASGTSRARKRGRDLGMTEEEQMRLAIEASLQEQ